jgi:hypothetical protein
VTINRTIVIGGLLVLACVVSLLPSGVLGAAQAWRKAACREAAGNEGGSFTTPLTLDQMKNKHAVVQTSAGTVARSGRRQLLRRDAAHIAATHLCMHQTQ